MAGERWEQQPEDEDAVMTRIGQAVMLHHGGDREEARNRLARLWQEIGEDGDAFHRCTLAHYLADMQDDPADELAWDLKALHAAEQVSSGPPHREVPGVQGFYASLHLNLAADYAGLQRLDEARAHLDLAWRASASLRDDRYAEGVRTAIGRMELRLAGGGAGETASPPGHRP